MALIRLASTVALHPHDVDKLYCGDGTYLNILCYGKRFVIEVSAENLQGDEKAAAKYLLLLQNFDSEEQVDDDDVHEDFKGDPMDALCCWIALRLTHTHTRMKDLAAEQQPQLRTLEDWLNPGTIILVLKAVGGSWHPCPTAASHQLLQSLTPEAALPSYVASSGISFCPTWESPLASR